jgi:hypothetical protein
MSLPVLRVPKRVHLRMPKALPLMEQYPLYALSFDGVDDYVSVSDSPSLENFPNGISITAFVKRGRLGGGMVVGKNASYLLGFSADLIYFNAYDGSAWYAATFSTKSVADFAWHHIAATFGSSDKTVRLYLDGRIVATNVLTKYVVAPSTYPLTVGYMYAWATVWYFNGLIASACVYNRALSLAEIQRNMRNPLNPVRDGLVLWLPMTEGIGTSVRDFSGYGNNGTLYNGVGWRELMKYEVQTL